jgi:membrane AbrB-like protein
VLTADRITALRRVVETLVIAAVGGSVFGLAGLPAGWLSGAILTVATASFLGRPMLMPQLLTRAIFIVIGMSLGSVVTPETVQGMASYPASIAILIVAIICISIACTAYLCLVHGWSMLQAYLASSPGAMSQVLVMANELGADIRAVAIVQSMRVVIVALGLPSAMSLAGLAGSAVRRGNGPLTWAVVDDLAILVAVSTVVAVLAYRVRFPGGLLFGAMFASGFLHGTGLVHAVTPPWVANAAMVSLGAVAGARFAGMSPRLFASYLGASVGSFVVSACVAGAFASIVITMLSFHAEDVLIAFAPGSVDAMMLLALALHIDPVYVGAHHVSRVIFQSLAMPLIARRIARVPANTLEPPRTPPTFQD